MFVKQLDLSAKVKLLEETPAVRIGPIRDSHVSWRNFSSSLSLSGSSVRTMGIHTTGSAVKNHISSKMAKELIAKNQTMYHS